MGEMAVRTYMKKIEKCSGDVRGIEPVQAEHGGKHNHSLGKFQQSDRSKRLQPRPVFCAVEMRLY